jgi:asparagine synthase (glutamine-hydrolysing)
MFTPGHGVLHGIHELPPATIMRFDATGMRVRRYWQLPTNAHRHDRLTTIEHVRGLLTRAVAGQADPDAATLCSGGLDSSAITALSAATHVDPKDLQTFDLHHTAPAPPPPSPNPPRAKDDGAYPLPAAAHLGTDHHTVDVSTDDVLAAHDATLQAMDLPSLTPVTAPMHVLFTRIGATHHAVLTGDGADELFRGYPMHHPADDGHHRFPWHGLHPPLTHLLRRSTLRQIRPGRYAHQQYLTTLEAMPAIAGQPPRELAARRDMWLIWQHYLPYVLRRSERLSSAAGVQAHMPYLDHRLVEYVWRIPPTWHRDRHTAKTILREAATGWLPDQITNRSRDHAYPAAPSASYRDVLWRRARDLLSDPNTPVLQLVSPPMLAAYLDLHQRDYGDRTPLLHVAHVLELDTWLRKHHVEIL